MENIKQKNKKKIHSEKTKAFLQTKKGKECIKKRTESIRRTRALLGTNGYHPNFNKTACKFFDYLNNTLGWKGKHALNGGEYYIPELGYWVDYYVPEHNVVIEWDEKGAWHFRWGKRIEKDKIRENKIRYHLKCKFVRILDTEENDYEQNKNFILNMLSQ